jgi:putative tricarboxylic transport membrane protein
LQWTYRTSGDIGERDYNSAQRDGPQRSAAKNKTAFPTRGDSMSSTSAIPFMRPRSSRQCLAFLLAAGLVSAGAANAQPAWKPDKPVELVIGTSPGGPQDHMGRMLQKVIQDNRLLDVPVTVVNKAGGGGAVGLAYLNQHMGQGTFVMVNAISILTNHITAKSAYAPSDYTPLAVMGVEYESVAVRADSPLKTGRDLVERLRKDPASLSVGVGTGLGTAAHLAFVLAMKAAGVEVKKLRTVAFNSGSEGVTAALGGHVDVISTPPSGAMQQVEAGRLRFLAVGAPERGTGGLARVPTWKEQGVNSAVDVWRGIAGPKGMTTVQIALWDDVLGKVAKSDEWRKDLAQNDVENVYRNSAETARYWKQEYEELRTVLVELGLAR